MEWANGTMSKLTFVLNLWHVLFNGGKYVSVSSTPISFHGCAIGLLKSSSRRVHLLSQHTQ